MKFAHALPVGARVRVRRDPDFGPGPWPAEPLGVVAGDTDRPFSLVETRQGPERTYFIRFDEPQLDPDGDGPYASSQVLERYLEPVRGRYRWRTELRKVLPLRPPLYRLVRKGRDCGDHNWYRHDDDTWHCYHCRAVHLGEVER